MSEHGHARRRLLPLVGTVALVFASTACNQLLDVTNPGDVTEEALQGRRPCRSSSTASTATSRTPTTRRRSSRPSSPTS